MEAALTHPSGRMTLGSGVVRIGSTQDNHVIINDPNVSPHHAEIRPEGQGEYGHTITDLGSATGTFVNGRRLANNVPWLLRPNDTIRLGDAVFNYEVTGAPQVGAISPPDSLPARDSTPHQPTPAPTGTGIPQTGTTAYGGPAGDPAFLPTAGASSPSSFAPGAVPQQAYPSTFYSPAAFAPPPTGSIAPGSPLSSVSSTYTVASLLEKENRRKLWLAVGITALIILLVAFLFGITHSAGKTLDTFCGALQGGDYQTAYNQLSPGLQGIVTESQFANSFNGNRRVTSCTHSSPNVSGNSATATITMNSGSSSLTRMAWLIQDSSLNWKIDYLR